MYAVKLPDVNRRFIERWITRMGIKFLQSDLAFLKGMTARTILMDADWDFLYHVAKYLLPFTFAEAAWGLIERRKQEAIPKQARIDFECDHACNKARHLYQIRGSAFYAEYQDTITEAQCIADRKREALFAELDGFYTPILRDYLVACFAPDPY